MKKTLLNLAFLALPLIGFGQTYCGPLTFTSEVEPISLVNFAGINNVTSAVIDGTPAHEFFLDQQGTVIKGLSYDITLKGNTNDFVEFGLEFTSNFMVFIDWNKDGDFADADEAYSVGSITGSTGTDGKQLVYSIPVPSTATPGVTRLRVKKLYGTTNQADPCLGASYGQAEDYSLNVLEATACSGTPTIGTATASVSNICLGTSFTLNSSTPATSGYKYQWQSSTDNGTTWNNLGTLQNFSNYTVASQSVTTMYKLIVTCSDSNQSATSNTVTVSQNAPNQCYCTNAISFNCTDGDVIQNVTFEGINNNSQCGDSTTGYSNYTSLTPAQIVVGGSPTFSVKVGPSGDGWLYESVGVWIDYNQNGVFDSEEYTYIGTGLDEVLTAQISVPTTALPGLTRMRVVVAASTAEAFTEEYRCGPLLANNPYGEMEDYTVNINSLIAVSETSKNNIKAYPNPVKDFFNIEAQGKIKSVKVFDISGKQLLTKELNEVKSQIDFSKFNPGVYVVTTQLEDGTTTTNKVIKK